MLIYIDAEIETIIYETSLILSFNIFDFRLSRYFLYISELKNSH